MYHVKVHVGHQTLTFTQLRESTVCVSFHYLCERNPRGQFVRKILRDTFDSGQRRLTNNRERRLKEG